MRITVFLIFLIVIVIGFIFLQIYLSRQKNKWLGLIMPIICFIFAIVGGIGNVFFQDSMTILGVLAMIIPIIFILLIPFYISMLIYYSCRKKLNSQSEINRMKIKDLE